MLYILITYLIIGILIAMAMRYFINNEPDQSMREEKEKRLSLFMDKSNFDMIRMLFLALFWLPLIMWLLVRKKH
jgi:hypothetical protein